MELNRQIPFGDVVVNLSSRILSKGEKNVELSKKEMDLLEFLIRNKGQTLTRELLLNRVWGVDSAVEDGNLDNYIYFLRRRYEKRALADYAGQLNTHVQWIRDNREKLQKAILEYGMVDTAPDFFACHSIEVFVQAVKGEQEFCYEISVNGLAG